MAFDFGNQDILYFFLRLTELALACYQFLVGLNYVILRTFLSLASKTRNVEVHRVVSSQLCAVICEGRCATLNLIF